MKHYRPYCFADNPTEIESDKSQSLSDNSDGGCPAEAASFKYRAFLSYSHRDSAWAKWLHKAFESYRIDKDLIGRKTLHGPVPRTLRPIFRDREDFSAGHSLTEQTLAALEASQFLVVICSPNAARSTYVDEEVRRFKAMGRRANVIPIIVDGVPGDPERECFPPAVRFKLDADGVPTSENEEPIAADARPEGDGKEIAKQKIAAGLLGVGLDEIMQRAARARKRRNRIRLAMASATAGIVAIGLVGWAWAASYSHRLDSAELISIETDAASQCVEASNQAAFYKVPEAQRIALVVKCVEVLSNGLDELSHDARLPLTFVLSFEANVTLLQQFKDAGKLTEKQSDLLSKAEVLATRLERR